MVERKVLSLYLRKSSDEKGLRLDLVAILAKKKTGSQLLFKFCKYTSQIK